MNRTRYPERVAFVCQTWLKDQLFEDAINEEKTISELIRDRVSAPYKKGHHTPLQMSSNIVDNLVDP
jgi:hypothetical protein